MATKTKAPAKPVNMEQVRRSLAHAQGSLDKALTMIEAAGGVEYAGLWDQISQARGTIQDAVTFSKQVEHG
jgi:hypothetical protein